MGADIRDKSGGEHPGGEAAGLKDHDLAVLNQAVIEEELRHLGGFAGAGRGREDEPTLAGESAAQPRADLLDWQFSGFHY